MKEKGNKFPSVCSCGPEENTHAVVEEEDPTEEAEQVGREQREVDGGGAAEFHHDGHEAVQSVHAQSKCTEQESWKERKHVCSIRSDNE